MAGLLGHTREDDEEDPPVRTEDLYVEKLLSIISKLEKRIEYLEKRFLEKIF